METSEPWEAEHAEQDVVCYAGVALGRQEEELCLSAGKDTRTGAGHSLPVSSAAQLKTA